MTLEEAIEILERTVTNRPVIGNPIIVEATELGVSALKAWKEAQREQRWPSTMRLPGETME